MRKADYLRFEDYLRSDFGKLDFSLFDMAFATASVGKPLHVVDVEFDGEHHLFVRTADGNWATSDVANSIVPLLKSKKKRESFAVAGAASRKFQFAGLGTKSFFSNVTSLSNNRALVHANKLTTGITISAELLADLKFSQQACGSTTSDGQYNIHPLSMIRERIEQNDFDWMVKHLENVGMAPQGTLDEPYDLLAGIPIKTSTPAICRLDDVVTYLGLDDESEISFNFTKTINGEPTEGDAGDSEEGEQDGSETPPSVPGRFVLVYIRQDGSSNPAGQVAIEEMTGTVLLHQGEPKWLAACGFEWYDEAISALKGAGLRPTGRYANMGGTGSYIYTQSGTFVQPETLSNGRKRYFTADQAGLTPYFGVGKGTAVMHTAFRSVAFELEQAISSDLDAVIFIEGTSEGGAAYLFQTAWNGGRVGVRGVVPGSRENGLSAPFGPWIFDAAVTADGVTPATPGTGVTTPMKSHDPLDVVKPRDGKIALVYSNNSYSLAEEDFRQLQGLAQRASYYLPVMSFLHSGDVFSVGDFAVLEDISLLTIDGNGEGEPFDASREIDFGDSDGFGDSFPGADDIPDVSDFPESEGDDGEGTDGDASGDITVDLPRDRITTLRYSRIGKRTPQTKTLGFAFDADGLMTLQHGQGFGQPMSSNQKKDLNRLKNEVGSQTFAGITFGKDVKIPHNVTDLLTIARDYAKAKKKACQTNDWDKQYYVKGVRWGDVKKAMNERGVLKSVYCLTDIDKSLFDITLSSKPASMTYVVGSSPAEVTIKYDDGASVVATVANQDPLWEGIAAGGLLSGISLETLSTSWELAETVDANDAKELKDARGSINKATQLVPAAMTGSHYVFDNSVLGVAGYPDIPHMPQESGWKAMIASVIIYEKAGAAIQSIVFNAPAAARKAYTADATVRIAKLAERYRQQ